MLRNTGIEQEQVGVSYEYVKEIAGSTAREGFLTN